MGKKFILGEPTIKFYDAKTGEEILPMSEEELEIGRQKEKERKESLKELINKTGYHFPELCPNCGRYYEGYNGHYEIDGDIRCVNCVSEDERLKLPFFAPEIPNYCEGITRHLFIFNDANDLYNKMKGRLSEGKVLVKDGNCIMAQSIDRSYWWVFGYINNYDMELLNIPKFDSEIYNENKTININKMNEWLKGKDIIKGNKDED